MGKKYLLIGLGILWMTGGMAQSVASSKSVRITRHATVHVASIKEDYAPQVLRIEAPQPDGNSEKAWLANYKAQLESRRIPPSFKALKVDSVVSPPWMGLNYQSLQTTNGVPNDNDMAVSNAGRVLSVGNSSLFFHDINGTWIGNVSLDAWSASLGLNGSKFDPRALYDPIRDRFIVSCLNGFTDSTSFVIVGFSQTNDPLGTWNLFALPGDPNGDSLWTDYPIMALSEHELFLTGNLLYNDQPWQTGFNQSICWQMDLDSAFLGNTLDTRLWFNVQFGGRAIRNLCPIQGGSQPAGTNMYLLSNRNFATGNDTVFIMEITDTLHAPGAQFLVDFARTDVPYSLAPNAQQEFNHSLATNDARWLDGFIENGNVQFVGNCRDSVTGRAAFYHGTITDIAGARTVTGQVIANPNGDYGYPAIAWMGMQPGSDEALLAINYSGTTAAQRPGCGAIYYDGAGGYSSLAVARAGSAYIDAIPGTDRWGDYTGVQTKYDAPGTVWLAATYGKSTHRPGTWVAEFHHPSIVSAFPSLLDPGFAAETYPNPTTDRVALTFYLESDAFLDISVWDMAGRQVKVLQRDLVRAGRNELQFSIAPLAKGVYVVRVLDGENSLAELKIVKE